MKRLLLLEIAQDLRALREGQTQLLKELKMVDQTVAALQADVTAMDLQVQSAVKLITDLRNQIANGGIDPADATVLAQIDTVLKNDLGSLGGAITPPPAPAAAKTA
jgi:hypothetical protein